jgi:hypothetical protein
MIIIFLIISIIIAMALMAIILMNWGNKEERIYLQRRGEGLLWIF